MYSSIPSLLIRCLAAGFLSAACLEPWPLYAQDILLDEDTVLLEEVQVSADSIQAADQNSIVSLRSRRMQTAAEDIQIQNSSNGNYHLMWRSLSGNRIENVLSINHTAIPLDGWYGVSANLLPLDILYSAQPSDDVSNSLKRISLLTILSSPAAGPIFAGISADSLQNSMFYAGSRTDNQAFILWGYAGKNIFDYEYSGRESTFDESNAKTGGIYTYHADTSLGNFYISGVLLHNIDRGGGIVEFPSASAHAFSRTLASALSAKFQFNDIDCYGGRLRRSIELSNRFSRTEYTNPTPIGSAPVDTFTDDNVFKMHWNAQLLTDEVFAAELIYENLFVNADANTASENRMTAALSAGGSMLFDWHLRVGMQLSDAETESAIPMALAEIGYDRGGAVSGMIRAELVARRPSYAEKYYRTAYVRGDRNLMPEHGILAQMQIGVTAVPQMHRFTGLKLSAVGFYQFFDSLIRWIPIAPYLTKAQNIADVSEFGFSVHAETGMHFENVRMHLAAHYLFDDASTEGYRIPYVFRDSLTAELSADIDLKERICIIPERMHIGLQYRMMHGGFYQFSKTAALSSRHLLDLDVSVSYQLFILHLSFENILNRRGYWNARQRPLPGFVFGARAEIRLL